MKIYLVFANNGGEIFECCVSGHFVVFLLKKKVTIETIDASFIDNFLSVISLFSYHFLWAIVRNATQKYESSSAPLEAYLENILDDLLFVRESGLKLLHVELEEVQRRWPGLAQAVVESKAKWYIFIKYQSI